MELADYKEYLISQVRSTADWRAQKAEEHPDDKRNEASSKALSELAEKLDALPDDHPGFRQLWWVEFGPDSPKAERSKEDAILDRIDATSEFLRRYGFHGEEDADPHAFLKELAGALENAN